MDPLWGAAPIKVCTCCHWVWFSAELLATFERGPASPPTLARPPAWIAGPSGTTDAMRSHGAGARSPRT